MKKNNVLDILEGKNLIEAEVLNGTKIERTFFTITRDDLINKFNVLPSDSLEEARKKIMSIASTDEFLYEKFHKNPQFWELKEFTPGYYTVPVKEEKILTKKELIEDGYSIEEINKMKLPVKKSELKQTYQQKLTIRFAKRNNNNIYDETYLEDFKEKYSQEFKQSLIDEGLVLYLTKEKFSKKPISTKVKYRDDLLLVIPDVELHLGKLSSKFDSMDSYDYKKALFRYINIINEAEEIQKMYKADMICMTIGNDFYNTDTEQNTTTAGTEQHNDTRFQQIIINGIEAHTWAIEKMKNTCNKVLLKFNPGNHDFLIDLTLYQHLYDLYKNDPKVEIKNDVKNLRFTTSLEWGKNLIIFNHGKTPEGKALNDDKLTCLKDEYFREESKKADYITVLAGHLHNATENNFSKKITYSNRVTVLRSGSPSGDGAWEGGNLYSSDKTHNVYVFNKNKGLCGNLNIKLTNEELEDTINMPKILEDSDIKENVNIAMKKSEQYQYNKKIKQAKKKNDASIIKITDKYNNKVKEIAIELGIDVNDLTEKQKTNLLTIMGYDNDLKLYLDRDEELQNNPIVRKKVL